MVFIRVNAGYAGRAGRDRINNQEDQVLPDTAESWRARRLTIRGV
jgi:hypothetical protein